MPVCALVGAACFNENHFRTQSFDCVIAVDRGYESLRAIGVEPDLTVGDFDSLGYVPEGGNVLRFPSEKDQSDMELAIRGAAAGGCDRLLFYGSLGGRLDHTLANLRLMMGQAGRGLHAACIGAECAVVALDGSQANRVEFAAFDPAAISSGAYGRCLSVLPIGVAAHGVSERGLKYGLDGADLDAESSLGLSNEFAGRPASVSIDEGGALVVFSIDAWRYLRRW